MKTSDRYDKKAQQGARPRWPNADYLLSLGGQGSFPWLLGFWIVPSFHLRYAIMSCAQTVINNEPTFAAYYAKKRAEGKEHRVALTHVANKLLRVTLAGYLYSPDERTVL